MTKAAARIAQLEAALERFVYFDATWAADYRERKSAKTLGKRLLLSDDRGWNEMVDEAKAALQRAREFPA